MQTPPFWRQRQSKLEVLPKCQKCEFLFEINKVSIDLSIDQYSPSCSSSEDTRTASCPCMWVSVCELLCAALLVV